MRNIFKDWKLPVRNCESFYGRKKQLEAIFEELAKDNPESIELVGERRIGKTSFLNIIRNKEFLKKNEINSEKYVFIYYDLQGRNILTPDNFYSNSLEIIIEELEERNNDIYLGLIELIKSLIISSKIRKFDFEKVCKKLNKLGVKIVVLFDEFDSLAKHDSLDIFFFDALRSLQTANCVCYITAAVKHIDKIVPSNLATSAFWSYFTRYYLGPFEKNEALELLQKESNKIEIELKDKEIEFICEYSGNHPSLLKIVTYHLLENRDIFESDFDLIKKKIIKDANNIVDLHWHGLSSKEQTLILSLLKNHPTVDADLEELEELKLRGVILSSSKDKSLSLFSKLFTEIISLKEDKITTYLKKLFGEEWDLLEPDSQISLKTGEIDLEHHKIYPDFEIDWNIRSYTNVFESELKKKIFFKIRESPAQVQKIIQDEHDRKQKYEKYYVNDKLISFLNKDMDFIDLGAMSKAMRDNDELKNILKNASGNDSLYSYTFPKDALPRDWKQDLAKGLWPTNAWDSLSNIILIVTEKYRNETSHGGIASKDLCLECRDNLIISKKIIQSILSLKV